MIRGTTPTITFNLPFDVSLIDKIWVSFYQKDNEVFTFENDNCQLEGSTVTVKLTQLQTLQFEAKTEVEIQLRILTIEGDAVASNVMWTTVDRILKDGEIT